MYNTFGMNCGGEVGGGRDTRQLLGSSFLGNLSSLKEKVNQVQSLVTLFFSNENSIHVDESSSSTAVSSMATLIQEIVVTASSMMFNCQEMTLSTSISASTSVSARQVFNNNTNNNLGFFEGGSTVFNWYNGNITNNNTATPIRKGVTRATSSSIFEQGYDIVELDADALLAKYTHYCQVCGKGFKRDANLRMHMRAHGDAYKTSAALTNPLKNKSNNEGDEEGPAVPLRKYSCPHMGCRWNKSHVKFQPLKSMICVKNHYKRSHCPKMYVCKRCNLKQFSVLSDLRTHEKHCGDLKWQCSCGTTFSRKDKLMGHVALFIGHTPLVIEHSSNKLIIDNNIQGFQNQLL